MSLSVDLAGRVALVTGAGQGVGRQIAIDLAIANASVAVNDYHADRAQHVAEEIEEASGRALAVQCDVTDLAAVEQMVATVGAELGPIDMLANNAGNAGPIVGIRDERPFWETGPEDWSHWIGTNLYGVLNCTRAVVGGMVERGFGRVVSVTSDAGRVGEPNLVAYSAAKAGAAGFSRALARAVGRANVTVNCVALGTTVTPATEADVGAGSDPELRQRILRGYAVKRLGKPADASAAVMFLCSDDASWITGQTLPVNGGYSMAL